jgi:hypothetical protein
MEKGGRGRGTECQEIGQEMVRHRLSLQPFLYSHTTEGMLSECKVEIE